MPCLLVTYDLLPIMSSRVNEEVHVPLGWFHGCVVEKDDDSISVVYQNLGSKHKLKTSCPALNTVTKRLQDYEKLATSVDCRSHFVNANLFSYSAQLFMAHSY